MTSFRLKDYQQRVLDSVSMYVERCHDLGNANTAFYAVTGELTGRNHAFSPLDGFPADMPYFCLRVPTGGGKTLLAASSVAIINNKLLQTAHSVVLWLVPSDAIREQTLKSLRNPVHPYHLALREAGSVVVLDLEEAKSITRATLDTSTVVIVSTVQAFSREDTRGLKVYQSSGALMHHFDQLATIQKSTLLHEEDGTLPFSLANVLRLRRPFLIVDEAHNARTPLRFATFERFNPSGVMELTATPDVRTVPSNVLHSVSAVELKQEEMIKLPIMLQAEPDWQVCLADAIARREVLEALAQEEYVNGAPYLRPIVLIQAEPRRTGIETLDVDRVKKELVENHAIPESEICIATGEVRGLEELSSHYSSGILDPSCPVNFVITQKALAEGWDCPFAYVLVGLSSAHSGTAVEQLLGRILRQPDAKARKHMALNQSYAIVKSSDFARVASELRDGLVNSAGFDRMDASQFVAAQDPAQTAFDYSGRSRFRFTPVEAVLPSNVSLARLPDSIKQKLQFDRGSKTLTIIEPLSESEADVVMMTMADSAAKETFSNAASISRTTAIEHFVTPAEGGETLRVPQLVLGHQGTLQLFDDPEVLEFPWELSGYAAAPTLDQLRTLTAASKVSQGGEIDVDGSGRLSIGFIPELQRDLGLTYRPEHWDEVRLAGWLCKNILEPSATHASKQAFVAAWLRGLLSVDGFTLGRANQLKFTVRSLLQDMIRELRKDAIAATYRQVLFGEGGAGKVITSSELPFEFHPQAYAPSRDYDGRFGHWDFRRHFYGRIGDFDSKEEFECATRIDLLAQQGKIDFWVRNLVNRPGFAFFLQKASGRFWPDFVCKLKDGTVLVVEYKGAQGWANAQDDRDIGGLWAQMSAGSCRFVMVGDRNWPVLEASVI